MPHAINWYDANKILLWEFHDHVTHDEFGQSAQEMLPLLDEAVDSIQVIADFRQAIFTDVFMPTAIPELGKFVHHNKLGWTAIVGITPSIAFMLKLITKAYGLQYAIFDNIEESADFLHQVSVLQKSSAEASSVDQTNNTK